MQYKSRRLAHWKTTFLAGIPASLVLFWQVPILINSSVWFLGFVLVIGLLGFWLWFVARIIVELSAAYELMQIMALHGTYYRVPSITFKQSLDLVPFDESLIDEVVDIWRQEPSLFVDSTDFVNIVKGLKNEK